VINCRSKLLIKVDLRQIAIIRQYVHPAICSASRRCGASGLISSVRSKFVLLAV
jgi:hypothetical protein